MTPPDGMRAKAETEAAIDKLEALVHNAKPVPLTDQVRLRPEEARQLIAELREAVAGERRARRYGGD